MRINIEITGASPLLMNRFSEEGDTGEPVVPKGTRREQATQTAYFDKHGGLYLPLGNILAAFTSAGKFHKTGKMKVTTPQSSLVPAALRMVGKLNAPVLDPKSHEQLKEFEVDSRRAFNHQLGKAVMRHRAKVSAWCLRFSIEVDPEVLPLDLVRQIVVTTGKKIGLGDFRPDRRGPFGTFKVTSWEDKGATKKSRSRRTG
jgi:hypothetical protein